MVVLVKELVDSCRDKRALSSMLLTVLIGPVITGFMMNRIADRQRDAEEVRIPIVGAQNAPALVEWLRQQSGVEVAPAPADPGAGGARTRTSTWCAIIPPDFAERFRSSQPGDDQAGRRQRARRHVPAGGARAPAVAAVQRRRSAACG